MYSAQYNRGFTLMELLIVMSIMTLLIFGATRMLRDNTIFTNVSQRGLNSVDEARKILRPLVGEVRSASPAHNGAYPVEIAGSEELVFYSDIDNDDLIERVRYFVEDGTLKKGITEPTGSPLEYVVSEDISWVIQDVANGATPVFEYFDSSYDGTTDALTQPVSTGDVRLIKINIIIDQDPTRPPAPVELTTQMTIRNLKDNL